MIKAVIVAGIVGAGLYYFLAPAATISTSTTGTSSLTSNPLVTGFLIGAGVQVGVRVLGVS